MNTDKNFKHMKEQAASLFVVEPSTLKMEV